MATTSFLKSINLKGRKQCQSFIRALENSNSVTPKKVTYTKTVTDMDTVQIQKIFGDASCQCSQVTSKSALKGS